MAMAMVTRRLLRVPHTVPAACTCGASPRVRRHLPALAPSGGHAPQHPHPHRRHKRTAAVAAPVPPAITFAEFVELCQTIESTPSLLEKTASVARFAGLLPQSDDGMPPQQQQQQQQQQRPGEHGGHGPASAAPQPRYPPPHLALLFRSLLPGEFKRVYNLSDRRLLAVFASVLGADAADMRAHFDRHGVLSATLERFHAASVLCHPPAVSSLTLQDVDAALDRMAGVTVHAEQLDALGALAQRCTPLDLNYVARLLKRDLRMNARTAVVLRALGPGAVDDFNTSKDLDGLISAALEPRGAAPAEGEAAGAEAGPAPRRALDLTLGRPVQPMLARPVS